MTNSQKAPAQLDLAIARAIRRLRDERGMSQIALGEAIGVTFQQVQKYEAGKNRISSSRLQRIADTLGIPVSTFFAAPGDPSEAQPGSGRAMRIAAQFDQLDERGKRAVEALIAAMSDRAPSSTGGQE